jgi:hypothetical protein
MRKFSEFMESKQEKICIIMRGLPGAGKSTKINSLLRKYGGDEGHIFSADNWFIKRTIERRRRGETVTPEEEFAEYRANWNRESLGAAHKWNQQEFRAAIDLGLSPVIVDNTNIKVSDFLFYIEYADKAGYTIKFEESGSPWWQEYRPYIRDRRLNPRKLDDLAALLTTKNTHGVPQSTIRRMIDSWQDDFDVDVLLGKKKPPKDK